MRLTATELRSRLYSVLDQVAETGEPVEIIRKGRTLRIVAEESEPRAFSFDRLVAHPDDFVGDLDDIVHMDWSTEWRPVSGQDP